jgi:FkbM family methyltransferase
MPSPKPDFRQLVRRYFPTSVWKKGALLLDAASVVTSEGVRARYLSAPRNDEYITVQFRTLAQPFTFRRNSHHIGAMINNIWRREYAFSAAPSWNPRVCIDAGAYIGDLSSLWATLYPNARIIALEPNAPSADLAELNLARYGDRASVVRKGLWSCSGSLPAGGKETGFSLTSDTPVGTVDVTDMFSIIQKFGIGRIDLLKLDIEGAESAVLSRESDGWIDRVDVLQVEFHGKREAQILPWLTSKGFIGRRHRSIVTFRRDW